MLKHALLTGPTPKSSVGFGKRGWSHRLTMAGSKETWLNSLLCPEHSEATRGPAGWVLRLKHPVCTVSYVVSTPKE